MRCLKGDQKFGWLFVLPALLILFIFTIFATALCFYMSFNDVNMFSMTFEWAGLDNYTRMLEDPKVRIAMINAISFMVVVVPIQTISAMALAAILNTKVRFVKGLKFVYFLPALTSTTAITLIFMFLFSVMGPVNGFLVSSGIITEPINFLNDPDHALQVVMLMNIWASIPVYMVIYMAGLQDIPDTLYEAADIDGAGAVTKFFKITMPMLRNVTAYIVMVSVIGTMQLFDQVFVMSHGTGGPENSTLSPSLLVYNYAFGEMNTMGYAAAIAISLGVFIMLLAFLSNKIFKSGKGVDE